MIDRRRQRGRSRRLARLLALAGLAAGTAALLELGTLGLVEAGVLHTPRPPRAGPAFWQGDHPDFGVWHHPNAEWEHRSACFRVTYRTNSVGARDVERALRSPRPRVVVLGDSFLEGWGVKRAQRVSERLEAATGLEHLNFAMAHFGPYQAYLVHRELATRFDHAAILLGVLPTNDFVDLDLERAVRLEDYDYRWRPYLVGDAPRWHHRDLREPRAMRLLRRHSYAWNALREGWRSVRPRAARSELPSGYYDFSERQLRLLVGVLERLADSADGRPVAVVLIPTLAELQRFARSGPPPLAARLSPLTQRLGFRLVDLLPGMARRTRDWAGYFHRCDYHWSPYGNAVVAELLLDALGPDFYEPLPEAGARPVRRAP